MENEPRAASYAEGGLLVEIAPVSVVTVNRPERLNALDRDLLAGIAEAIATLEEDAAVRAVVVTGAGDRAFAAGADLRELAEATDAAEAEAFSRLGQAALARIATSRLPTVAAVNGLALGGGCELAVSCDMRVAARGAVFGMPEVSLGLVPGFGGTQRLPRLIGRAAALRLILSGDPIDAEEAARCGLVEAVVDDGRVLEAARALAGRIARHDPAAVVAAKSLVHRSAAAPLAQGLLLEAQQFGRQGVAPAARTAVEAFFARRSAP